MKYEIIDPKVQKTYYYAKKILDSQGFTQHLEIYLALGRKNQPQTGLLGPLRIVGAIMFIAGIVLLFKNILLGITVIVTALILQSFFVKKYHSHRNLSAIKESSQRAGSHKLMRIVAEEMSKGSSVEQIVLAMKKEIQETLKGTF
ncbi:MAG: hypothetical protein ACKKMW_01535 [Candidatus Nealsonbacteria bacterium]